MFFYVVLDYNKYKRGIDRIDQLLSYYSSMWKSLKWYRKVVLQHLDFAVSNSYILYTKIGGNQTQIWFRNEIIRSLISSSERKDTPVPSNYFIRHKSSDVSQMEGQHYMEKIPATSTKATPTRQCVVCNSHQI
ncbi:hypothetical protein AVEN_185930-1 [Araneus ventricosus]|uniref:PiggyBac transposable element-derived protein domain-containing protein n=1 Tax=Araneus ventricosus TaxID=182803 RepID=A0A4Y2JFE1_ARAVE|nr:hypothetical protein AVEN_185930-1 [Araneus ventricosus]